MHYFHNNTIKTDESQVEADYTTEDVKEDSKARFEARQNDKRNLVFD